MIHRDGHPVSKINLFVSHIVIVDVKQVHSFSTIIIIVIIMIPRLLPVLFFRFSFVLCSPLFDFGRGFEHLGIVNKRFQFNHLAVYSRFFFYLIQIEPIDYKVGCALSSFHSWSAVCFS